jgi:hypothetical protein
MHQAAKSGKWGNRKSDFGNFHMDGSLFNQDGKKSKIFADFL